MTSHAPISRVPFAPLDNPRLHHLASAKNRQNGLLSHKTAGKPSAAKNVISPAKRAFEIPDFDEFDSENVDPALFDSPSKKSKSDTVDKPVKPFTFTLTPAKSMAPPPTIPSRLSTPTRANMSSPRAPLTAPAGRSPKRKVAGIGKTRRISAPFSRIDPPFSTGSTMPFSLDAALSGTFSKSEPKSAGATIQESMPRSWFFDIHEDTPEEEAANLMEHSTLTLDLSSDDENSRKKRSDRGKENTPPDGYDAPTASRSSSEVTTSTLIEPTEIIRRKIASDEMDDGERSPLSDLETEPFIPEGLDKDSHVVVEEIPSNSKSVAPVAKNDEKVETTDEIVVWEDAAEGAAAAA